MVSPSTLSVTCPAHDWAELFDFLPLIAGRKSSFFEKEPYLPAIRGFMI